MAAYRVLCRELGRAVRFAIDVPRGRPGASTVTVRWRCGCVATGPDLDHVSVRPCDAHAASAHGSFGAWLFGA